MPEPATKEMCPRCKVLRNVSLVAPKRCLVCASDTEPCVTCKQVVVPLGAQYCPLCLTPQEDEGLPTSVVDQIRCESMDEERVMHTCIAYVRVGGWKMRAKKILKNNFFKKKFVRYAPP